MAREESELQRDELMAIHVQQAKQRVVIAVDAILHFELEVTKSRQARPGSGVVDEAGPVPQLPAWV